MAEKYIKASECEKYFYEHLDDVHIAGAMNTIDDIPAADVAPVVHARWIGNYNSHCSCCGAFCTGAYIKEYPNYCPNCGAKMDVEER